MGMSVPTEVVKLVEQFGQEAEAVRSSRFKEAWVRRDYIDPLFTALGWDVAYEHRGAQMFREVILEDTLKVEGATKAPDYCFYVKNDRKFFVEAKKPSVHLLDGRAAAFQVRRYAWSAKLPLSLLTDFEELAVYDCRIRPVKDDKASTARNLYMGYEEYPDRWDEIASLFSKEAVLSGSLDAYVQEPRKKKGVAPVDQEFLKEMESWREMLAKDFALRNPSLTGRELNYAVQMTIDRIVFLRICEDRGIEDYGNLESLLGKDNVYEELCGVFKEADDRYNSGLFHFREERGRNELPDDLTPNLRLADRPLNKIIKGLYYPESPYQFSVMPVEIMGQVYEQFLGKVISINTNHRVVIEEKPEVRKAGGVYYTPSYIVEYIVKNTVGKLVEGKTPQQVSKLRILDPACGSGSFLIGAYDYLLEWHRQWYVDNGADKHAKLLYEGPSGEWQLKSAEKKRILLNNIHGVDIDPQAVEVTKLSLLLKVLEDETNESINSQLTFFKERALPDLDNNIKWGNSLIGSDFYENEQMMLLDEEEHYRINVFDWKAAFPKVFSKRDPGFDAVIGNPPYLRIQGLQEHYGKQLDYFIEHYASAVKRFDLYLLFTEKGVQLLNTSGYLGFIIPHKFLNSAFGSGLRDFLVKSSALESFISFGSNLIFDQASTYTGIITVRKAKNRLFSYYEFPIVPTQELQTGLACLEEEDFAIYDPQDLSSNPWAFGSTSTQKLLSKLGQKSATVGDVFESVFQGIVTGADAIYFLKPMIENGKTVEVFSKREGKHVTIEKAALRPLLKGDDVNRYAPPKFGHYCIYPYKLVKNKTVILEEVEFSTEFPLAYAYLQKFRDELTDLRVKYKTNPRYWYSCHRGRSIVAFASDRIITSEISFGCNMTLDTEGLYHNTTVYSLLPSQSFQEDKLYWLGLLNSKVMWWFLKNTGNVLRGGYFRFKTNYLKPFPVPTINFTDPEDVAHHNRMVGLVERMLSLHEKLAAARINQEKTVIQRQIDATDHQIDALVYELYELNEEEIEIVEG